MSTVTFEVGSINERKVNTKYGLKSAFDLVATDGTKYGFAFNAPAKYGIAVGTKVTGIATPGKYGMDLDAKTVSIGGTAAVTPTPAGAAPAMKSFSGGASGRPFPVPNTSGEMAIIRQNALTNAVATVADFIATQPSEKWPTLDTWTDMVIDTAYKFAKFSSGQREIEAVKKLAGVVPMNEVNTAFESALKPMDEGEEAA